MNLTDFTDAIKIMCESLPCQAMDRRVSSLYHFFGNRNDRIIRAVAEACARKMDRFPTPKIFGECLDVVENMQPKEQMKKQTCDFCDGYGWITIENVAYRGRCAHSAHLSPKIAYAPSTNPLSKSFDATKIIKGILAFTGGNLSINELAQHAMPIQRLARRAMDELREKKVQEIRSKWLQTANKNLFTGITRI